MNLFKLPSIEELVEEKLEAIDKLKKEIESSSSYSKISVLSRKLEDMEELLTNHKALVREIKIKKLID